MQKVIVTGLSGSGKSVALNALEDLGFYCVDNLPTALLQPVLDHLTERFDKVALGVDVRGGSSDIARLPSLIDAAEVDQVIFLTADAPTLIRRYSETRRKHPLDRGDIGLTPAIGEESAMLDPILRKASTVIDTSGLSVHQLRRAVFNALGQSGLPMVVLLESFGFKLGVPTDVDMVFDARCLPNPHWVEELRPFTGRDQPVRDYLGSQETVRTFIDDIHAWLTTWLPMYEADNRNYFTIGIGCTGGKHRSVFLVEELAQRLAGERDQVLTFHRQLT